MQNSNKILKVAVLLLLVANIALVAFMVLGKKKPEDKRKISPEEMFAKELGLSEDQKATHRQMKDAHMKVIRPLMDSLRDAKTAFYMQTKESELSDSLLTAYSDQISALQIKVDKATLAHFKRVRVFLKPEQQPKFDTLVKKMMQRGRKDTAQKAK
jgi:periplasmic protein CpxP/Spy